MCIYIIYECVRITFNCLFYFLLIFISICSHWCCLWMHCSLLYCWKLPSYLLTYIYISQHWLTSAILQTTWLLYQCNIVICIISNFLRFSKQFSRNWKCHYCAWLVHDLHTLPLNHWCIPNNKIGPSTYPCVTQVNTGFQLETCPSTTTLCRMSVIDLSSWLCRFPFHVVLTWILVFDVELYQKLSGDPHILHLPVTHHQPT